MKSIKRYFYLFLLGLFFIILTYNLTIRYVTDDEGISHPSQTKPISGSSKESQRRIGKKESELRELNKLDESFAKILDQDGKQIDQNIVSRPNGKSQQHLLDYLGKSNLEPFDFGDCRMSNCFDYSRCDSGSPIKVHIVPSLENETIEDPGESNIIHRNILTIIKESIHYEPDPEKACLFVLQDDTLDRDPLSSSFRPNIANLIGLENNYGMNHLFFNLYSGTWPDYKENDFAGLQFGAAIIAKASNNVLYHRPGFDISLPLFSYQHPKKENDSQDEELESMLQNFNRTYFLTFKGKRYVTGSGSETRNSLYHLNNERDVILLTTCRHGKKWRESSDSRCSEDEAMYDRNDFIELMKDSIFCLVPRGRRLGSFRFLESLSYGCIPVVMSDGWVKPFDELIDWSNAIIQFDEKLLLQVPDILRDIEPQTTVEMRRTCVTLYKRYFSTTKKIILNTLSIIEQRIKSNVKYTSGKVPE